MGTGTRQSRSRRPRGRRAARLESGGGDPAWDRRRAGRAATSRLPVYTAGAGDAASRGGLERVAFGPLQPLEARNLAHQIVRMADEQVADQPADAHLAH